MAVVLLVVVSCIKEEDASAQYDWQSRIDEQIIQLFMMNHKILDMPGRDTLALVEAAPDDPENIWNTRYQEEVTSSTPYTDLLGKAFRDTTQVESIQNGLGSWILIKSKGESDIRPTDSSTVWVKYGLTLAQNGELVQSREITDMNLIASVKGFRYGMPYFYTAELENAGTSDAKWSGPGEGWIFIPSRSAYQGSTTSSVPPYSVLVFQVQLTSRAEPIPPSED